MRSDRLITPALRAGLLIGIGSALFAGPFAIGLSLLSATTRSTAGPVAPNFLP